MVGNGLRGSSSQSTRGTDIVLINIITKGPRYRKACFMLSFTPLMLIYAVKITEKGSIVGIRVLGA